MNLNSKNYDILKWIVQVVMPAVITLVGTIGTATAWSHTEITMTVLGATMAFLGSVLGLSGSNYYKDKNDTYEQKVPHE